MPAIVETCFCACRCCWLKRLFRLYSRQRFAEPAGNTVPTTRLLVALKEPSAKWICPSQSPTTDVRGISTNSPPSIELNDYNTIRKHFVESMILAASDMTIILQVSGIKRT